MKKFTVIAALLLFGIAPAFAQLSLGASAGYQFNGKVNGYYGTLNFKDGGNYGIQASYWVDQFTAVEFSYTGTSSNAIWEYPPGEEPIQTGQNWFQLGSVRSVGGYNAVKPFGAFSLGATQYTFDSGSDQWFFSVTLGGGAMIDLSDRVGIRLQGRFMMPLTFSGVGIGCGIGSGGASCGGGAGFWAPMLSGDLSAGIYFRLGE
jgi:hypothetical protein